MILTGANSQLVYQSALAASSTVLRSCQQRHLCKVRLYSVASVSLSMSIITSEGNEISKNALKHGFPPQLLDCCENECFHVMQTIDDACFMTLLHTLNPFHSVSNSGLRLELGGSRALTVSRCGIPAAETVFQFFVSDLPVFCSPLIVSIPFCFIVYFLLYSLCYTSRLLNSHAHYDFPRINTRRYIPTETTVNYYISRWCIWR
jgi:hypothetical protein